MSVLVIGIGVYLLLTALALLFALSLGRASRAADDLAATYPRSGPDTGPASRERRGPADGQARSVRRASAPGRIPPATPHVGVRPMR